jgi:hypothetical protein
LTLPFHERVKLRNPWGANPEFKTPTDAKFWVGKNDPAESGYPSNDTNSTGYFWMSLSDFYEKFTDLAYEK